MPPQIKPSPFHHHLSGSKEELKPLQTPSAHIGFTTDHIRKSADLREVSSHHQSQTQNNNTEFPIDCHRNPAENAKPSDGSSNVFIAKWRSKEVLNGCLPLNSDCPEAPQGYAPLLASPVKCSSPPFHEPLDDGPPEIAGTTYTIMDKPGKGRRPDQLRRKKTNLYYRQMHKYLLFRSDQQLLYQSCIFVFGSLISVLLLYILWFTDLYWLSIRRINVLEPDHSISFRNFHKIPVVDNTLCVTIFNITNLDEFYASDHEAVLDIQPVGPYCFREDLEKVHIRFNENRTRVSYSENSSFHFLPSRSNGSLNDVLNVISFPYLTITARVSEMNLLAKLAISTQMKTAKYQPFVTLTARQFLYGYEDDFLTWTYKVGTTFGFYVPYKRFSMLDSILDQINSNFTVDTGLQDIDTLQRVQVYNERPDMGVWRSDKCNAYDGTDGTFYEYSKVTARQNLSFFSNFLCRNVEMVKVQETPLFSLSTVPRYSMIPELFHYNNTEEEEDCYCVDPPCIDNLFYTADCFPGPIVFSYKYFYGVNRTHLKHLSPLPEPGDWRTYFEIHPALGTATSSTQRIQLNLQVRKAKFFNYPSFFKHRTILPGVYLERTFPALTFEAYWYLFHATFTMPALELLLKISVVITTLYFTYYWTSVLISLTQCLVGQIRVHLRMGK